MDKQYPKTTSLLTIIKDRIAEIDHEKKKRELRDVEYQREIQLELPFGDTDNTASRTHYRK